MRERYQVGIVILNYNAFELIVRCINSIYKWESSLSFAIYIVDNGSTDDSLSKLYERYGKESNITLINAKINGGYSYGNNCGIREAIRDQTEYIVIANPDTYLENDAISKLVRALTQHEEVGAVGPELLQPDGTKQFARTYATFGKSIISKTPFRYVNVWPEKWKRTINWEGKGNFVFDGMVAGCFFLVRSKDFKQMDGFDEDFFLYYEEDVIAYKLKDINKKSMIVPKAKVFHDHSTTTKKKGKSFIYYYYRISEFLLLCKYTKINVIEKILLYAINILWIFMFTYKNKEMQEKKEDFKRILKEILIGNYHEANPNIYEIVTGKNSIYVSSKN